MLCPKNLFHPLPVLEKAAQQENPHKSPEEIHKTDAKLQHRNRKVKGKAIYSISVELIDMDMGKMPGDNIRAFLGKSIRFLKEETSRLIEYRGKSTTQGKEWMKT